MSGAFFSPVKLAIYPASLQSTYEAAGQWPSDAIQITDDEITSFFCQTPPEGKTMGSVNGRPAWVDLPDKTTDELTTIAQEKISELLAVAAEKVAPLQDAFDLGIATDDETTSLTAWKNYRVLVNRVTSQSGYPTEIDWPPMPE